MIYNGGFLEKEMKGSVTGTDVNIKHSFYIALFLGGIAFGFHYFLKTLSETVLYDALPEVMLPSYFSVGYMYLLVSFIFFVFYFAFYYDYLTFIEISQNRWYTLTKLGYNPVKMLVTKMAVRLLNVLGIYVVGFVFAIILTALLKYPFVPAYLFNLLFVGFVNLLFLVAYILMVSLAAHDKVTLRIMMAIGLFFVYLLSHITGFYLILKDRVLMQSFSNIIRSPNTLILLFLTVAMVVITIIFGQRYAQMYTPMSEFTSAFLVKDYRTGHFLKNRRSGARFGGKILGRLITGIGVALLTFAILINGFVLLLSFNSNDSEFSIGNYIPYVFQSVTMEPTLQKNDFILFSKISTTYPLKVGDVVIFEYNDAVRIEAIEKFNEDSTITLDITNYVAGSVENSVEFTVERSAIYGIYQNNRSRWLGALILFANDLLGRILMFVVPILILFFEKQIQAYLDKKRRVYTDIQIKEQKMRENVDYFNLIEEDIKVPNVEIIDAVSQRRLGLNKQVKQVAPEDDTLRGALFSLRRKVDTNVKQGSVPELEQQPAQTDRKMTKEEIELAAKLKNKSNQTTVEETEVNEQPVDKTQELKVLEAKVDANVKAHHEAAKPVVNKNTKSHRKAKK